MIENFIANVKKRGVARTNRYQVLMALPWEDSENNRLVQLFCDGTQLPGITAASAPLQIFGEEQEMPYGRTFEGISLSFYVDADLRVKYLFDNWMSRIIDPQTRQVNYQSTYATDIIIRVVDPQYDIREAAGPTQSGNPLLYAADYIPYELTLHTAWPKTLYAINMDAASRNDAGIMKLQVLFEYKYWTSRSNTTIQASPTSGLPKTGPTEQLGAVTGSGGFFSKIKALPGKITGLFT